MEQIFINDDNKNYYLATNGLINCRVNVYNEWIHNRANVFFKILNKFDLEYYVFAGSAVGLVRNGENIPWVDDYDVIVFKEHMDKYKKDILPVLLFNGFYCNNHTLGDQFFSGCFTNNNLANKSNMFHCDIFFSYIDDNNFYYRL